MVGKWHLNLISVDAALSSWVCICFITRSSSFCDRACLLVHLGIVAPSFLVLPSFRFILHFCVLFFLTHFPFPILVHVHESTPE
jgi:hypothetical protein